MSNPTAYDYLGPTYVKVYWFRSLSTNSIADNTVVVLRNYLGI